MAAPPLKTDPKYGYFPRWPEDGDDWVHPDDVAVARGMIPSGRIFRRDGTEGDYAVMHYGDVRLRVRHALWQAVEPEGIALCDWVEVLTRGMRNEAHIGTIREMLWDDRERRIHYQITENGQPIAQFYTREDLRNIDPVT